MKYKFSNANLLDWLQILKIFLISTTVLSYAKKFDDIDLLLIRTTVKDQEIS